MVKKLLAFLLTLCLVLSLSGCCCVPGIFEDSTELEAIVDGYSSYVYEEESEISYASEESSSPASQPEPKPESQPQTSQPEPAARDPKSYTMHDYYGMTINDVANIWGQDYALGKNLIAGGWAYIYYNENCPFIFCYQSNDIPTSCSGNERLSGVIAYPYADENEFLVIEGLSIVSSYATVSSMVGGEYWINEMDGGYSYNCGFVQNHNVSFTWTDDPNVPYEVSVSFNYMY